MYTYTPASHTWAPGSGYTTETLLLRCTGVSVPYAERDKLLPYSRSHCLRQYTRRQCLHKRTRKYNESSQIPSYVRNTYQYPHALNMHEYIYIYITGTAVPGKPFVWYTAAVKTPVIPHLVHNRVLYSYEMVSRISTEYYQRPSVQHVCQLITY